MTPGRDHRAIARLLVCALAAALVAACGDKPRLAPLGADAVVLAFGDSLTFGTGASEAESYPAQLAQLIGRNVVRAGVPGEVTAHALERLPAELDEHAPRLLLLLTGGNDFLRNAGMAQAERNVREMVKLARARGVEVVLIAPPERSLTVTPPKFYARIAKEFAVPYEGGVIGEVLRNRDLKSDPIHPNARGYRLIAERIAELLRKSGAV
jgi:lysophospholipase L1-like esterase